MDDKTLDSWYFKFKKGDKVEVFDYISPSPTWKPAIVKDAYVGYITHEKKYDLHILDEDGDYLTSLSDIPESNIRPCSSSYPKREKIPWEKYNKDSHKDDYLDCYRYFPLNFPSFPINNAVVAIDTDSIKVKKEDKKMKDRPRDHKFVKTNKYERRIKEVMFNGPATIIKWEPTGYLNGKSKGDKTVSVCGKNDIYDKEKGFLLAIIKEFVDNQSYDNILRMMDSFNNEERK